MNIGIIRIMEQLRIHELILKIEWFCLVLWHINPRRIFNAKSSLYIECIGFGLVWFGFMAHRPL